MTQLGRGSDDVRDGAVIPGVNFLESVSAAVQESADALYAVSFADNVS